MIVAEIFEKGGPIVWVLLVYSFIALALVLERVLHYLLMEKLPPNFEQALAVAYSENRVDGYL